MDRQQAAQFLQDAQRLQHLYSTEEGEALERMLQDALHKALNRLCAVPVDDHHALVAMQAQVATLMRLLNLPQDTAAKAKEIATTLEQRPVGGKVVDWFRAFWARKGA